MVVIQGENNQCYSMSEYRNVDLVLFPSVLCSGEMRDWQKRMHWGKGAGYRRAKWEESVRVAISRVVCF